MLVLGFRVQVLGCTVVGGGVSKLGLRVLLFAIIFRQTPKGLISVVKYTP